MSKFDFATPHKYVVHRHCIRDHCPVCDGGFAICEVCNLSEGSLSTHCPGYNCAMEHGDAIFKGELDYRNGAWIDLSVESANKKHAELKGVLVSIVATAATWFTLEAIARHMQL